MINKTKKYGIGILAAVMLLFSVHCPAQTSQAIDSFDYYFNKRKEATIGLQYPQFSFKNEQGDFSNEDLKDKISFINLWFEACPPCIAELPSLNKLYLKYKGDPNFIFMSFTFETPEKIKQLRKKYHLIYPIISISKTESYRLNQNFGFPVNIVLDKNEKIQYLNCGGQTNRTEVQKYFEQTIYDKINGLLNDQATN